jgi:hypothetical protein
MSNGICIRIQLLASPQIDLCVEEDVFQDSCLDVKGSVSPRLSFDDTVDMRRIPDMYRTAYVDTVQNTGISHYRRPETKIFL